MEGVSKGSLPVLWWRKIRGPLPGLAPALAFLLCCEGVAGVPLVHPKYWMEVNSHGNLFPCASLWFGCEAKSSQRCFTHSKADFVWLGILWRHLPWSFVFLIGCCLCRDLVFFMFLPQICSQALPLLPALSLENYFSVLSCAEGTISSASGCFLTSSVLPCLVGRQSTFMYPSCSRFCWFVSLYWLLCS